jgi:hypothetical protein
MRWEDTFLQIPGRVAYLWDNKQTFSALPQIMQMGDRVLKRIDKGYAPLPSAMMAFTVTSKVIPGYCFSDHLPVLLECKHESLKR